MSIMMLFTLLLGAGVRLLLCRSSSLVDWLLERNELVTPLTSWKRLTEGLALRRAGISPYTGDVYHEMPLTLHLIGFLEGVFGSVNVSILFTILDVLLAFVLDAITKQLGAHLLQQQASETKTYNAKALAKLKIRPESVNLTRLYVASAYMFNPLTIACCVARSTGVFGNLAVALAILFTLRSSRLLATLFVAIAAYHSLYPIMLLFPVAIYLAQRDAKSLELNIPIAMVSIVQTVVCVSCALAILLYSSFLVENSSWLFLQSTYGFILSVPDLSPNIGVFWYFFTEIFDHFRVFFLCVFQIHVFVYSVPLTFRLYRSPMFLAFIIIAIMSLFKSYPSYADTTLYLALLPQWRHVTVYTRNNLVVGVMFVVSVVLSPVLWHLWIQTGTANANFYFAITLVLSTAQIFLITDVLLAFLRREYDLRYGAPVGADGKPVPVILE